MVPCVQSKQTRGRELRHSQSHARSFSQEQYQYLYISGPFQRGDIGKQNSPNPCSPRCVSCVCSYVCTRMSASAWLCSWTHEDMGLLEEKGGRGQDREWG